MKITRASILALALLSTEAVAFSSFNGTPLKTNACNSVTTSMEYIPSGMSKEQWKKVKEAEKQKQAKKNLGKVGITSFKSRSFADWQKAGGVNLFPVDPKTVKDPKDIPYMQRAGGTPDGSDLKKSVVNPFANIFGKKKAPEPAPAPEKKPNWWNLS